MELSKRLAAIGAMMEQGSRLADIGTDHGYLPIWLVEQGIVPAAVAMDINEGPLLRAKAHVKEHGLEKKIVLKKSDGFEKLLPGEADVAVIAGMGGLLTIRILEMGKEAVSSLRQLILSPQSEICEVRRYLHARGAEIVAENMVLDEGKYYVIMKVNVKGEEKNDWSYIEEKYGKYLLRSDNPVMAEYLEKEKRTLTAIKNRLKEASTGRAGVRLLEIERELLSVETAMEEYRKNQKARTEREKQGDL